MRKHKLLFAGMLAAIAGAVITGLLPPLVLERLVNQLTGSRQLDGRWILLYVMLLAVAGIFDGGKEGLITIFGQKVTHGVRSSMCEKLSRLPAEYYTKNEAGMITSRFVNDVDTIETLFDSGVISMIADGCKVLSILAVIFVKSKGLGVLMLVVTPVLLGFTLLLQKRMLRAQMDNRAAVGKANNHIPETIENIRTIHTFSIENYMERKYGSYIAEGYEAIEKSNFYDAIYSPVIITISAVIIAAEMILSALGGDMQTFFGMSVGTAVAVISYVSKVFEPLESIGMEIQNIQAAVAGIYRIREFMEEPERNQPALVPEYDREAPVIAFDHVTFGYTREQEILHDLSFQVAEEENFTLTGRTGIGKSTVFKLILGMYQPWSGTVKIYGIPAEELSDRERARLIGYVEQSFHQIPGTVRDQITLKDEAVTEQQVAQALRLVGLEEKIRELPEGLDTVCSELLFSQGQFQLLSIARAVVHQPPVLLLDEITANLDSVTEKEVLHALQEASANRTVLSISHRVQEGLEQESKTLRQNVQGIKVRREEL